MEYPALFPTEPTPAQLTACANATKVGPAEMSVEALEYLIPQEEFLLATIHRAAAAAGVHIVNPNTKGTKGHEGFVGHDVCAGKKSWFNYFPDYQYSYHPNKEGPPTERQDRAGQ